MAGTQTWALKSRGALPNHSPCLQNNHIRENFVHHRVYRATVSKMHRLFGLVLFSVSFTTVFARNDTILHGWHSESHERGTWSILWGCLATIFICTWSVLHLDVPDRSASDLKRFATRAGFTLLAIIAPEVFLAIAIDDTLQSFILSKTMNRDVDRQQGREAWSLTHVRFLLDNGFAKDTESDDVWDPQNPEEVFNIPRCPPISKKELKSRSATDWIANTLALFQISWFGAQLLVRRIQHLHITAMEILTLAFILCSILTFILCWPEPQNVAYPVVLPSFEDTPPQRPATTSPKAPLNAASEDSPAIETSLHRGEDRSNNAAPHLEHSSPEGSNSLDRSDEVQYHASDLSEGLDRTIGPGFIMLEIAGCVFGAVHCLAWNSTFPTPKERLAWRVCSVATTALPIVGVTAFRPNWFADHFFAYTLATFYIIARLTLVVLALMSLRAVPADVFQTTDWSNIIPHIGL